MENAGSKQPQEPIAVHASFSQPNGVKPISEPVVQASTSSPAVADRKFSGQPSMGTSVGSVIPGVAPGQVRKPPKPDRKWSTPNEMKIARSGIEPIAKDLVCELTFVLIHILSNSRYFQTFDHWSDLLEDIHEQPSLENIKKIIPFYEKEIRGGGKGTAKAFLSFQIKILTLFFPLFMLLTLLIFLNIFTPGGLTMKAAKNLLACLFNLAQQRTNPLQPVYTEVSVEALAIFLFFLREGKLARLHCTFGFDHFTTNLILMS